MYLSKKNNNKRKITFQKMKFDFSFEHEGPAFIADLYSENKKITMSEVMSAWSQLSGEANMEDKKMKRDRDQFKRDFIKDIMKDKGFRADHPSMTQKDLKSAAEAYYKSFAKSSDAPWFIRHMDGSN